MKKLTILVMGLAFAAAGFSQSEKYTAKMKELIPYLDSMSNMERFGDLANSFERVGDVEKTQWLPYYYSAMSHVMLTYGKIQGKMGGTASIVDPAADKAEALLNKALALTKENSETWCLKKMIASLRMMADPMSRWQTYGAAATEALEKAREMDPNNPRVYILEAQDKYYTPEQFGGSKAEAKVLFEKAKSLFDIFKPETELHPNWGKPTVQYFLSLTGKE